jgi:hypothetical protein
VLGQQTVDYVASPVGVPVIKFEFEPGSEFNKKKFTGLRLTLRSRGVTVLHGFYSSSGDSFVKMPTLVTKR